MSPPSHLGPINDITQSLEFQVQLRCEPRMTLIEATGEVRRRDKTQPVEMQLICSREECPVLKLFAYSLTPGMVLRFPRSDVGFVSDSSVKQIMDRPGQVLRKFIDRPLT
jgi:hypothetical protein